MAIEHLDMLIDEAREAAVNLADGGQHGYAARLESCAEALVKLRDERTARDAEMRDERARVETAESEVARLTERLATAEKAAHEWRKRAEGMWSKEHVRAAFVAWYHEGVGFEIDGMTKEEREGPAVRSLEELIAREESGA